MEILSSISHTNSYITLGLPVGILTSKTGDVRLNGMASCDVLSPCSLLECYREEGLQLSYVIQQHEG